LKKPKVVSWKNLPTRLPITWTITWYLFFDRIQAPSWAWGAMGVIVVVLWIVSTIAVFQQQMTDVFKD